MNDEIDTDPSGMKKLNAALRELAAARVLEAECEALWETIKDRQPLVLP